MVLAGTRLAARYALLLGAIWLGCGFAQVAPIGPQPWRKLRGEHVDVYSNASTARSQQVLDHVEALERAYSSFGQVSRTDVPRLQVLFFADAPSYLPFQVASQAPAFFQRGRGREVIVAHDLGEGVFEVLRHEFFHVHAGREKTWLPKFLEEGLADVFSTIDPNTACLRVGAPIDRHLRLLANSPAPSLRTRALFKITPAALDTMKQEDRQFFYAKSWLLANFLFRKSGGSDFDQFVAALRHEDAETALQQVYEYSPEELDRLTRDYIPDGNGIALVCRDSAPSAPGVRGQTRAGESPEVALASWEIPLLQADVLAFLGKRDAASNAYRRIAREHPDLAEVRESQGLLALEQFDLQAAQAHFKEAADRNSKNAVVYHQLASLRCGMQSEESVCLEWIDRAMSLDEDSRESRFYAIDFALNVRDFPRALRYLEGAHPESDEDRFQLLMKTAYAHYRLEDFDSSRDALTRAEALASGSGRRKEVSDLRRAIDQRENFVIQRSLFAEASASNGATQSESLAKALKAFTAEPGAILENGVLREILCQGERISVLADTPSGRVRLHIEDAMNLMVLRGTQRLRELDLVCGPRKGELAQFGYLRQGDGIDTHGVLRILRFTPNGVANN